IRVDAVDNVDADLLQIAADYFKAAYGVAKNDATATKHLSILEDWSHNDPLYVNDFGDNQLTMDDYAHTQLIWSLTK
ncbi:glycoside hydrolase family 70 protein, partial [Escherichia coli]|uniref:glycoside hydrolase family 70 protein n=1 Tax=Escherichia coli TaxID=562 RepID=UPI0035941633